MKIAVLGSFDPMYPRNRIIIRGLRLAGTRVLSYTTRKGSLSRILNVLRVAKETDCDAILLGHIGQYYVLPLKLFSEVPIVLDVFAPLYESLVIDRKLCNPHGYAAVSYFLLDLSGMAMSDLSIVDTFTHRQYISKQYGIPLHKLAVLYPGSDDSVIHPVSEYVQSEKTFTVSYHGSFIPFHGVEFILHAAYILRRYKSQISFQIIGKGQTFKKFKELRQELGLTNVKLIPPVPYDKLRYLLSKADVCLGAFGNSPKLDRVVPFKIFDALAMGKPIITGSSSASREILRNNKNCLFCERCNPHDLANKIIMLFENRDLTHQIGENGYMLFKQRFTPLHLGKELLHHFRRLLKKNQFSETR